MCECVWQQLSDKSDKERVRAPFLSSSRLLRFSGFYVDAAVCVWVCETDCVTCLRRIFSDIEQQNGFPSEGSSGYLHQEPSGRFWDPAESRRRNLRGGLQGQLLCTAATCTCSLKSGLFNSYLYFKKPFTFQEIMSIFKLFEERSGKCKAESKGGFCSTGFSHLKSSMSYFCLFYKSLTSPLPVPAL